MTFVPAASVAVSVVVPPSRVGLSFAAARPLMGTSTTVTVVSVGGAPGAVAGFNRGGVNARCAVGVGEDFAAGKRPVAEIPGVANVGARGERSR